MPKGVSVRGRLLFAFLGISAFAVLAAAASMWAFLELGRVVQRTTEVDTPAALASLELSRQAERIAAGAQPFWPHRMKPVARRLSRISVPNSQIWKLSAPNYMTAMLRRILVKSKPLWPALAATRCARQGCCRKARNRPEKSEAAEPPLDHSDRHQPTGSAGCSRVGL